MESPWQESTLFSGSPSLILLSYNPFLKPINRMGGGLHRCEELGHMGTDKGETVLSLNEFIIPDGETDTCRSHNKREHWIIS